MRSLRRLTRRLIKAPARRLIWQYQKATWRSRSLPNFIIIGAQKSGTTSLFHYLGQHPQLLQSFSKEVHFFDGGLNPRIDTYEKGEEWYRAYFPSRRAMSRHHKTFEASPLYIFNPLVPRRIHEMVPEVRIIALLRNPTERAISHYFHEKRKGRESLSISEALRQEDKRLEPVLHNGDYKNNIFIHHSYKHRGLYKEQLGRFRQYFSRERMLVLSSEEFFRDTEITLKRVFDFVGVDTQFKAENLKPINVAGNRSIVSSEVHEYLDEFFLPHNQALYELLGENCGW